MGQNVSQQLFAKQKIKGINKVNDQTSEARITWAPISLFGLWLPTWIKGTCAEIKCTSNVGGLQLSAADAPGPINHPHPEVSPSLTKTCQAGWSKPSEKGTLALPTDPQSPMSELQL